MLHAAGRHCTIPDTGAVALAYATNNVDNRQHELILLPPP